MKYNSARRMSVGFIALSCLLVGLAPAQTSGGVLRAGMQADPVGLDPHTASATTTRNQMENIYDTLVTSDPTGRIVPSLATKWTTSKDNLTWTFTLRGGVKFHNGRTMEANDVVFSINRIKDPATKGPRAGDFALVESITAPNKTTVVFKLTKPFSPLLAKLAFTMNAIVPKEAVSKLNTYPVGTGPFQFVEYVPQVRMVLKKNPNYWRKDNKGNRLPYLDGITYTYLPDATARVTALRTNTVDWIEYVPGSDIKTLKADDSIDIAGGPGTNFRALFFNIKQKPLDDVRVRQALSYAINPTEIVDVALLGVGGTSLAGTPLPKGNYFALPDPDLRKPNLDKARELLKEAGYPNGFTLDMKVTSTYDFLRTPAEIVQAELAAINVKVNINAMEWSVFLPDIMKGNYMSTIYGESGKSDPDDYFSLQFLSNSNQNITGINDKTIDNLLTQGRETSSPAARKPIYNKVQDRLVSLSPAVFLFTSSQYEAFQKNVRGYQHYANSSYLGFRNTWIQR